MISSRSLVSMFLLVSVVSTSMAVNGTTDVVNGFLDDEINPVSLQSSTTRVRMNLVPPPTHPTIMSTHYMEQFWAQADEAKLEAQYSSDVKLQFLQHASLDEVRKICMQYRYFVHHYPNHLGTLVTKLPYGNLKSLLAQILAEELGSGKDQDAHIVWYDNFLLSIGVTPDELENSLYPENEMLLQEIHNKSQSEPFEYLIGLCGMGGECLCQIYLTSMHRFLVQNKALQELELEQQVVSVTSIDWTFWKYHIGEEDVAHRMLVRKAINGMILQPSSVQLLAAGYQRGKSIWDEFWTNNYKETTIAITM